MGGRAYSIGHVSLAPRPANSHCVGLGAGTAARGRYDVFGCICTAVRLGGGFGCPVIESFAMLAETTASVIGAAADFTSLGGGGLIQPAWAGCLLVLGNVGTAASSSLSNSL